MFRAFFSALTNLTASINTLTASFTEANATLRQNLALDHADADVPALEHENGDGKRKVRATK